MFIGRIHIWEYEDEYRIVKNNASRKSFILPEEAITEIILGCNMGEEDIKEISDVLIRQLPHVKILQTQPQFENFHLDLHEVFLFP